VDQTPSAEKQVSSESNEPFSGAPQDARNGAAVGALSLGFLAMVVFPVGPLFGVLAVALGLVALGRARNLPANHARRGMAAVGICLGAAGIGVWGKALIESARSDVRIRQQSVCAANLSAIGNGLQIYANECNDWFPVEIYNEAPAGAGTGTMVSYIGQMGALLETRPRTANPRDVANGPYSVADPDALGSAQEQNSIHPSRSLFMLIIAGVNTPKLFICPSSGDVEDDMRNSHKRKSRSSTDSAYCAACAGIWRYDFMGYSCLSYGYQLPYGAMAKPSRMLDPRMPIVADKGPYFRAGPPRSDDTVPDEPTMIPGTSLTIDGATSVEQVLQLTDQQWQPYNSRNHGGNGQNVLSVDGSVSYAKRPILGVGSDNIYTQQGPDGLLDVLLGRTPADKVGPRTNTDSLIVP
jgi:hypothetical protein